jgi:Na+/H+-translocating membrane pyrophosphatase
VNEAEVPDSKLLDALAGLDAEADMMVVQRTRRAVMEAAHKMREARMRTRYQAGLVLLAVGALLMFLTPALWVVAEDAFSDERWLDAPALTALVVATIVSTVFAAIVVQWRGQSGGENA